jgi:histidine triad (HIT) family protein
MKSCLFCRIIRREIPSKMVHEDEHCVAFEDINPQAPVHLLIVPKKHIERLSDAEGRDQPLLGHLFLAGTGLAREREIAESGFRMVVNSGAEAGQTVFHLHLHLMGGRTFRWPPG